MREYAKNRTRPSKRSRDKEDTNLTIRPQAEVWLKIARGEMSGPTAFMTGKFKVSGSLDLLMKLARFFSPPAKG